MEVIEIIGGTQKHQARRSDGIIPCLTSSMGCGGGYIPMIVIEQEETPISLIDLNRGGVEQKSQDALPQDTQQESRTTQPLIVACFCNGSRVIRTPIFRTIISGYHKGLWGNQGNPAVMEIYENQEQHKARLD